MAKIRERSMFPRLKSHLRHTHRPKNPPPSLICQKSKQLKCLRFVCVSLGSMHVVVGAFWEIHRKLKSNKVAKNGRREKCQGDQASRQRARAVQRVDMRESNTKLLFKTPRASRSERGGKKQAPTTYKLTDWRISSLATPQCVHYLRRLAACRMYKIRPWRLRNCQPRSRLIKSSWKDVEWVTLLAKKVQRWQGSDTQMIKKNDTF